MMLSVLALTALQANAQVAASAASVPPAQGAKKASTIPFSLTVPGATDGATFALKRAAKTMCGGEDVSPPLSWKGAPAATRSFAVTMFDPDGREGLGVVHWIRYGIPGDVDRLDEGAGTAKDAPGRGGKNTPGTVLYHGACPPAGEIPHHYVLQIYALDLPPDALPVGLTREVLLHSMLGHILASTSVIQRYGR